MENVEAIAASRSKVIEQQILMHLNKHPELSVEMIAEDLDLDPTIVEDRLCSLARNGSARSRHEINIGYLWKSAKI